MYMFRPPKFKTSICVEPSGDYEQCLQISWQELGSYFEQRNLSWNMDDRLAYFCTTELFKVYEQDEIGFFMILEQEQRFIVADIHVYSAYRNKGYGSKILQYIKNMALSRGFFRVWLNVFADNPAVRLYERSGFKVETEKHSGSLMSCELTRKGRRV